MDELEIELAIADSIAALRDDLQMEIQDLRWELGRLRDELNELARVTETDLYAASMGDDL